MTHHNNNPDNNNLDGKWRNFVDSKQLACSLAAKTANLLQTAIADKGRALLAVSGGNTPKLFFTILSRQAIDWSKVLVFLVDERCVENNSQRSNEAMVNQFLLRNKGRQARFISLYEHGLTTDLMLKQATRKFNAIVNNDLFDVLLLGMGTDGHTASLFPDADNIAAGLDPDNDDALIVINSNSVPETRLSLTLVSICKARQIFIHIEGQEKRQVLEKASRLKPDAMANIPISMVIAGEKAPFEIYWAP